MESTVSGIGPDPRSRKNWIAPLMTALMAPLIDGSFEDIGLRQCGLVHLGPLILSCPDRLSRSKSCQQIRN
jgi:hypothetical protein